MALGLLLAVLLTLNLTTFGERIMKCEHQCSVQACQSNRTRLSVPVQLVLEDPACAQKLLEAANITNVRIRTAVEGRGHPTSSHVMNSTSASPEPSIAR